MARLRVRAHAKPPQLLQRAAQTGARSHTPSAVRCSHAHVYAWRVARSGCLHCGAGPPLLRALYTAAQCAPPALPDTWAPSRGRLARRHARLQCRQGGTCGCHVRCPFTLHGTPAVAAASTMHGNHAGSHAGAAPGAAHNSGAHGTHTTGRQPSLLLESVQTIGSAGGTPQPSFTIRKGGAVPTVVTAGGSLRRGGGVGGGGGDEKQGPGREHGSGTVVRVAPAPVGSTTRVAFASPPNSGRRRSSGASSAAAVGAAVLSAQARARVRGRRSSAHHAVPIHKVHTLTRGERRAYYFRHPWARLTVAFGIIFLNLCVPACVPACVLRAACYNRAHMDMRVDGCLRRSCPPAA